MECWNGEWIEIVIDCAEWFGVPCEGGVYIPPEENECCSECVLLGDINMDSNLNVLDVVSIVDIILNQAEYNILADLNYDNLVNILDVVVLVNMIISSEIFEDNADLNQDNEINVLDIVLLVNLILG